MSVNKVIYRLERGNVLLSGSGGTGKSFTLKSVAETLQKEGHIVYLTSTTGVSALSLTDKDRRLYGSTIHSWAGIGLGDETVDKLFGKIMHGHNKKTKKRWLRVKFLIIDEISMLGGNLFSKLNRLAQMIRRNDLPFGGINLLLCGDFLQLPPIRDIWVFESKDWERLDLYPIILSEPKRFDDMIYFEMLSRFRYGIVNDDDKEFLKSRLDEYIKWKSDRKNSTGIQPTFLFSKKIDVDRYNKRKLEKLPGRQINFNSEDIFTLKKKNKRVNREMFETYMEENIPSCIPLKVGAQVMLKVNLNVEAGLVNGSRGVVLSINNDLTEEDICVLVKWKDGTQTNITKYTWKFEDKTVCYTRTQIPLILAWSHSIHKSQSITLDYAVCSIGDQIFADAQAYVALSRVRNRESLLLSDLEIKSIRADKTAIDYCKEIEEDFKIRETIEYKYV